ncbi:MAG: hypothetical protein K2X03_00440 [Bryobacteraceae bacterium]|nr:hypothetical protein [Bryobacteraceae bacterium]
MRHLLWLLALSVSGQVHQLCQPCHTEAAGDVESHKHFAKQVSCDACHGTSEKHRLAAGGAAPDRVATREQVPVLCGGCHVAERKSYETSAHAKVLAAGQKSAHCATCHGNHAPRPLAAMAARCQSCHTTLPAACAGKPRVAARVSCAGCHTVHTFAKR